MFSELCGETESPPIRHRFPGIDQQVHEGFLHLVGINQECRYVGAYFDHHANRFTLAKRTPFLQRRVKQHFRPHRPQFRRLLSRKSQEVVNPIRESIHFIDHILRHLSLD